MILKYKHLKTYRSRSIVIATGFYDAPYLLNIPGENLDKFGIIIPNPTLILTWM